MPHLFYFVVPSTTPQEGEVILQGEEAHHAIRVVRIKIGEPIAFIDGMGGKWLGEVVNIFKDKLIARIKKYKYTPPEEKKLSLIVGYLHRDNAIETIINYGTELGISEFRFFQAEHSTRPLRSLEKGKKWIIQACKTTGREWFPALSIYKNLETAIKDFQGTLLMAVIQSSSISIEQINIVSNCGLIIGPEGDLSEAEITMAREQGALAIHFGPYIFRSELSALLGSCLIMQRQQRFEKFPQKDFLFDP
ncbi:MAG: RsmE family RNA methyltransferase [Candidatus Hydrogenedens sp.]